MLGVRNPRKGGFNSTINDDGTSKCGEIWLNELRLTDFDERGGYAANGRINARLADFANVNLTGSMSTIGFGSIDQSLNCQTKVRCLSIRFFINFCLRKFLW